MSFLLVKSVSSITLHNPSLYCCSRRRSLRKEQVKIHLQLATYIVVMVSLGVVNGMLLFRIVPWALLDALFVNGAEAFIIRVKDRIVFALARDLSKDHNPVNKWGPRTLERPTLHERTRWASSFLHRFYHTLSLGFRVISSFLSGDSTKTLPHAVIFSCCHPPKNLLPRSGNEKTRKKKREKERSKERKLQQHSSSTISNQPEIPCGIFVAHMVS